MTDFRRLTVQLHQIAWSAVQGPPADPWAGFAGTREHRRAGALQLLAIYSRLVTVLQRRIDLTIKDALEAGSDYGQIAAACGVSRQAVRQRCLRRTPDPRWFEAHGRPPRAGRPTTSQDQPDTYVRLAGGPHHGGRDIASAGQVLRYQANSPVTGPNGPVPLLAWYLPSADDASVYVFGGVEPDIQREHTGQQLPSGYRTRKPRVYELAAELRTDSKTIMVKLQEMGEFTRSAASAVPHPAAHRLRLNFAAQTQRRAQPRA